MASVSTNYLRTLLRLSRAQMTVITGTTHLTASLLSPVFNTTTFIATWIFILLTQFMTHFLGEYYDLPSDRLNIHSTPLTGGTKLLPRRLVTPLHTLQLAFLVAFFSLVSISLLPVNVRLLAFCILLLASQYSAPPFMLNHHAFGEFDAVLITSILVPILSTSVQSSVDPLHLILLILPPSFAKLALFLVLNQADRRPDYAGGKITLPVILGDVRTTNLHKFCMHSCYTALTLIIIYAVSNKQFVVASAGICMALSAPMGYRIVTLLRHMPYRIDHVLPYALLHSTMIMWGLLLHALIIRIPRDGIVSFPIVAAGFLGGLTMSAFRKRPVTTDVEAGVVNDPTNNEDENEDNETGRGEIEGNTNAVPSANEFVDTAVRRDNVIISCDVTVVGGGVAGLVAATALRKMGFSIAVLERRSVNDVDQGADLALWPGAITILKTLGVSQEFFGEECFPLDTVHMCNMDFSSGVAEVLKSIDMGAITADTGERFVLVPRQRLMSALRDVVPEGVVMYDCTVVDVVENEEKENVIVSYDNARTGERRSMTSSIAIGADGARSRVRQVVSTEYDGEDTIRYCGEVCYRGILELSSMSSEERTKVESLFPDRATDHTMRINYGAGLRSSFGYMTADGNMAYWWVKQISASIPERTKLKECSWPEPLRSLHDLTPADLFYMHAVEDSKSLPKWCGSRVVLIGDAAHVVTPNMGQGACLAAEDAFVLAVELAKHWKWPDGHLEAFYRYEYCRKPYAEGVAAEARKQLFLGQLQAWPLVRMREWLLRVVPESVLRKTLRKNNFDVASYVEEFREGESGNYSLVRNG